jgi:hypothetical protein
VIYTAKKWHVKKYDNGSREYDRRDGTEVYVTSLSQALSNHDKEAALRDNQTFDHFRNVTTLDAAGATAFGTGGVATFIGTGPGFDAVANGFIIAGGSILSLIALTFAGCGFHYGKTAYEELRVKRSKLPDNIKRFSLSGTAWTTLQAALTDVEKEEAKKARVDVPRGYPSSMSFAVEHIMMDALRTHSALGIAIDPYISNYLLTTNDLVKQAEREDQDESLKKELKATLLQAARREMENIYPHLYQERESMDIKVGTRATKDEFANLATRGEAIAAAKAAMDTVKASYSIS